MGILYFVDKKALKMASWRGKKKFKKFLGKGIDKNKSRLYYMQADSLQQAPWKLNNA